MSPHFDELYSYLKSKGIMVTVLTNGVLLDRKIELFKKYNWNIIVMRNIKDIITDNII